MGKVDPYATLDIGATRRIRTRFVRDSPRNVTWNERFELYVCDEAEEFVFEVKVRARGRGAPLPTRGRGGRGQGHALVQAIGPCTRRRQPAPHSMQHWGVPARTPTSWAPDSWAS